MSESKFLPFQDANGDGQNDDCPEKFVATEPFECPECEPNPKALVPNWRDKTKYESFLNEKNCKYQITIVARDYTSTNAPEGATEEEAQAALDEIYKEYEDEAIEALLETHEKDNSPASVEAIRSVIEYTDYWLDARPFSRLKLMYSVPHEALAALDERDSDEDEEEEDTSDITVSYSAHEMDPMMMKVRKGLNLYNRYLKVYRAVDQGNLKFTDGDKVFNLENYGDIGLWGGGLMASILPQLDEVLNKYGYNIPNVGGYFSEVFNANDTVTEITFTFDYKYKIKKIEFYTEGCGNDMQLFNSKAKELLSKSAWKDRTAMAYFTKLREMETALTARTPEPWIEFLVEYTYPEIYATQNEENLEQDARGCVEEALADEAKQLGQDILDDVFSIGDAIAFKFHEQLCKKTLGEKLDEDVKLGVVIDRKMADNPLTPQRENEKNIRAYATEQAFQQLEDAESPFISLCARIVSGMGGAGTGVGALSAEKQLDILWKEGFDELKICGLFDILMEAITCLMSGLSLEEALGKVLEAGLRAMSINNLGDLFIGLPYEKQQEIGELAKKKIQEGDVFAEDSLAQELSDGIAGDIELPSLSSWAGEMAQKESDKNSPDASTSVGAPVSDHRRTLATEYDSGSGTSSLSVNADAALGEGWNSAVLEAYIKAILEVYGNDLLSLADELNRFPGAQMIATIIALMDCPRPPIFQPGLMDWMNDIELPICKNVNDINWPKLINISAWYPKIKDLLRLLYEALKYAIQMVIIKILIRLIVKLCELIGNAICNALGTVGDIAASLPDIATGRDNLANVIKDSICGDDADQSQVEDTIAQMVAELGVGGAALADQETAVQFAQGISMSLTQAELTQMLLGEPSSQALTIIDNYIEYEHPDYRDAMPNKEAIGSFMSGMGNLFPASFKAALRDQLDAMPDDMPAHPSICADPEKLEEFKELRCEILEGRATPEQCEVMFDKMKEQMADDLGDLSTVLQAISSPEALDQYLADQMPPTYSDPGCDNGLLPYEPAVTTATVTAGLGNILQQLKVDYGTDMLGNGPGQGNWGLINMMLSDTMGNPLTAHMRKAAFNPAYKDFNGGWDPTLAEYAPIAFFAPPVALALIPWTVMFQAGAYPTKVGAWLQDVMTDMAGSISVDPNNDWQDDSSFTRSLDDLGQTGLFGTANLDMVNLPDFGYNVTMKAYVDDEGEMAGIRFTEEGRKATADLKIEFSDNAAGLVSGPNGGQSVYGYGFDIEAYFADLYETEDGEIVNRKSDNMRIKIVERLNMGARTNVGPTEPGPDPASGTNETDNAQEGGDQEMAKNEAGEDQILYSTAFEFLAEDSTLTGISDTIEQTLQGYPNFYSAFQSKTNYGPQTLLLTEMLEDNGYDVSNTDSDSYRADVMKEFLTTILNTIADADAEISETAWAYGAQYDDLTETDIEYGVNEGGWIPYSDTEYSNQDMVLGMSYNQYEMEQAGTPELTRVFYLDPGKFGGNYVNPPLYIKPLKPIGWMGVVDAFFPELSPCKPQSTDLIDFGQIQDEIDKIYPSLQEDERLKSDPDCIEEVPYNRILDRSAKAGMYGLIIAAIRIHVSAHMMKTLPTFTKFSPKFPDLFGSAYASYIVENMENSFLDAQPAVWEVFNTFKDSEFWYSFLEMCVQMYNVQIDAGLANPSPEVLEALFRLNDLQEDYMYPNKEDLKVAKDTKDAGIFQTLKGYRGDKNTEAIRATEEDAKLVMKELVKQQLDYMSTKLEKNFAKLNLSPDIVDMGYYMFENMAIDSELTLNSAINPDGTFKASYGTLPEVPYEDNEDASEPYYTFGGELVVAEDNGDSGYEVGQEYVGYYHVHIDEDYAKVYMAGEYHTEDAHDLLKPLANVITVPIGNVPDYNTVSVTGDASKPLILEKYISINGTKYAPDTAAAEISTNDSDALLSDIYPGSMTVVENEEGVEVGIEGELGVRYGVLLSLDMNGTKREIMTAEIDALDLKIKDFRTLTGDSKNLLCLINKLKESDEFQLLTRYIFGSAHLLSIAAIYNDMGMLASIGEVTVANGDTKFMGNVGYESGKKPGLWKDVTYTENDEGQQVIESVEIVNKETDSYKEGKDYSENTDGAWSSKRDRTPGLIGGIGVMEWDNWDRELLTNSNSRIKKIFKAYYYSREFDPDQIGKSTDGGPAAVALKKLRGALMPAPGRQLVPWWQRKRLKSNPFNADDELCEKKDV